MLYQRNFFYFKLKKRIPENGIRIFAISISMFIFQVKFHFTSDSCHQSVCHLHQITLRVHSAVCTTCAGTDACAGASAGACLLL